MHDEMKQLASGVQKGDRRALAKAITLVESQSKFDKERALQLLSELQVSKSAISLGITGSPGVGKSTLIDSLGMHLLQRGHRVAVLAIDPTSPLSKGSILGDKTRMPNLSKDSRAFIRPSPSQGMLGGVAPGSGDVMKLLEAAGFDVIIVETVGVGQSEVAVSELVDTFVLLVSPTSGDELQGVKKGIVELAHIVGVTKNDGDLTTRAEKTRHEYLHALSSGRSLKSRWRVPVELLSSVTGEGISELWQKIMAHQEHLKAKNRGP